MKVHSTLVQNLEVICDVGSGESIHYSNIVLALQLEGVPWSLQVQFRFVELLPGEFDPGFRCQLSPEVVIKSPKWFK